eukprot:836188-Prorocentrum_minimum.AAC.1
MVTWSHTHTSPSHFAFTLTPSRASAAAAARTRPPPRPLPFATMGDVGLTLTWPLFCTVCFFGGAGSADVWTAWNWQDDVGEGGGDGVRDHLLQRVLRHPGLQVPRGERAHGPMPLRNGPPGRSLRLALYTSPVTRTGLLVAVGALDHLPS